MENQMAEITDTTRPATAISQVMAHLSFVTAAAFVALLAALHVLKPELDPSWRFISEYAIGDYGGLMVLAFLSLALSYLTLFLAIRSQLRTLGGRIGLALLLVSAAGLIVAGIFTTDPITAGQEAMTTEGYLHSLGGWLGFAMPFAAALVSYHLARKPAWSQARRSLIWAAILAWIGFLVSFMSLGVILSQSGGQFGPGVWVGWPTRFEILAYSVWLMVVSWRAAGFSGNLSWVAITSTAKGG
jgi:hypothetical protein